MAQSKKKKVEPSGMAFYLHGRMIDRGNSCSGSRVAVAAAAAFVADLGRPLDPAPVGVDGD